MIETTHIDIDAAGTARLTMNRPQIHNAFDDALIAQLTADLQALAANPQVRAVVLAAAGKSFSAGADLNWMRRMADYSEAENLHDANQLSRLLNTLNRLPKPTIARVQGAAFGGGVGLVACCDMAVAAERASFCLSEVKLGLIPATIGPFVVDAIGNRNARRYFLTAERFSAAEARRIGLLHEVVADEAALDAAIDELLAALAAGGPAAQFEAKELIFAVDKKPIDEAVRGDTAARIARIRASDEGREGLNAFLGKRKAEWIG